MPFGRRSLDAQSASSINIRKPAVPAGDGKRRYRMALRSGGVLLSLAGMLACNALGLGLGRILCQGLFVAALGAPLHKGSRSSGAL